MANIIFHTFNRAIHPVSLYISGTAILQISPYPVNHMYTMYMMDILSFVQFGNADILYKGSPVNITFLSYSCMYLKWK